MIKIAFICVHNSCRSQIVEALEESRHPKLITELPSVDVLVTMGRSPKVLYF